MKTSIIALIASIAYITSPTCFAESDNKSGFGFGMGSGTPTRNGNNYDWGFGPADEYDRRGDGIERSSATGGMSWGNGRNRYRNSPSFFSFGPRRGYYGPPHGYYQDWRGYPPARQPYPYWQQYQQPASDEK